MKHSTVLVALFSLAMADVWPEKYREEFADAAYAIHNQIRTDPKSFIPELKKMKDSFDGKARTIYIGTKQIQINTVDGSNAVERLITFLEASEGLQPLTISPSLQNVACKHVNDQGGTTAVGHRSPATGEWAERIKDLSGANNQLLYRLGENLAYGVMSPRDAVITLGIDDGVDSTGHLINLLDKDYQEVGVCYGKHKLYTNMISFVYRGQIGSGALYKEKLVELEQKNALKFDPFMDGTMPLGGSCARSPVTDVRPSCSSGLCCGQAFKYGGTKIIEVCQANTATTYKYFTYTGEEEWTFTCVQAANRMKAVSTAIASILAATYLLV